MATARKPAPLPAPAAFRPAGDGGIPVELVAAGAYAGWLKTQSAATRAWLQAALPTAKAGLHALLPGADGKVERVIAIHAAAPTLWEIAALPFALPPGAYRLIAKAIDAATLFRLCLGWGLGSYEFTRYRAARRAPAQLMLPGGIDAPLLHAMVEAQCLARDLINTPAGDLGPAELAQAALDLAARHGGTGRTIVGAALLKQNFPLIHAVGRAAEQAPRLVDLSWGNPRHPKVTLVGKGVCFDTGGLDIKSAAGMYGMKGDMGGAASVLATAHMIMSARLPVRLRVLIGAVENAIGPTAMRPGDVVKSRAGITVEIQDTDAEGRLILADMLALAAEEQPAVIVDMATLTGAVLKAVGYGLAGMMTAHNAVGDAAAAELAIAGAAMDDPVWRLPVWTAYADKLDSTVADILSCSDGPFIDGVLAAVFLQRFALPTRPDGAPNLTAWVHLDMSCENPASKPGRPQGGEGQGARAVFQWLRQRYGDDRRK